MTNQLTKSISKKLLAALLIVTIGAEVLLYLTRYSHLAGTLYDAVMVASIFVGIKLHRLLNSSVKHPKTKRQLTLQFTAAFLFFFFGSTIINMYSNMTFNDFNDHYDGYVEDYTAMQAFDDEPASEPYEDDAVWPVIDKIDSIGSDIYLDTMAGLEEVWRLAYITLFLIVCKKLFHGRWESGRRDIFVMAALFFTSVLFGVDHTLDTEQSWQVRIGAIVTFANMGFLFGIILLWTRNLWLTVLVHSLYDITATLSWYYIDYAVELFALTVLVIHIVLFIFEKLHQKRVLEQAEQTEASA